MRFPGARLSFALSLAAGCGLILDLQTDEEGSGDGSGAPDARGDAETAVDASSPSDAGTAPDAGDPASCVPLWVPGSPPSFGTIEPVAGVNTVGVTERNPALSADGLTLWFDRLNVTHEAHRASVREPFVAGDPLPAPLNVDPGRNGRISFTADELEVFMASRRAGRPSVDIWHGSRASKSDWFDVLTVIPPPVSYDDFHQHDPHVSADGSRLYWSPSETDGAQRLWAADRQSDGSYGGARVIEELSDGSTQDADVATTADEQLLFFARTDPATMDAPDLMYAVRTGDGTWGAATTVAPLVTEGSEADPYVSADGCELFFMRDVDGELDVWHAWVER